MLLEAVLLKNKLVMCVRVIPGPWQIARTIRNSASSLIPTWQPPNNFRCLLIRQKYSHIFLFCNLVVAGCSKAAGNQGKGTLSREKQDRAASRHGQLLLLNTFMSKGLNLAEIRSIKSVLSSYGYSELLHEMCRICLQGLWEKQTLVAETWVEALEIATILG